MRTVHRLVAWQRSVLFGSGTVLLVSGAAWLALHYGRSGDELPSPLEAWAMRLHGLAAFAVVFALGALAASHIPQGWRLSQRLRWAQQRGSGVALCTLGALLVASGYALYYFAPEGIRPPLGWAHAALGLVMTVVVVVHRRRSSRARRAG